MAASKALMSDLAHRAERTARPALFTTGAVLIYLLTIIIRLSQPKRSAIPLAIVGALVSAVRGSWHLRGLWRAVQTWRKAWTGGASPSDTP